MHSRIITLLVFSLFVSTANSNPESCFIQKDISFYIQDDDEVLKASLVSGHITKFHEYDAFKSLSYNRKHINQEPIPNISIDEVANLELGHPYHVSQYADLMAISIYEPNIYSSNAFAIIDIGKSRLIEKISVPKNNVIFDIKLNTKGTSIAVIYAEYVIEKDSWLDKFAMNMGHPKNHYNFKSSIYDAKGKLNCSFELISEVENPNALIVWEKTE